MPIGRYAPQQYPHDSPAICTNRLKERGLPTSGTKAVLLTRLSDPAAAELTAGAAKPVKAKPRAQMAGAAHSAGAAGGGGAAGRGRLAKPKGRDNFVRMNMKVNRIQMSASVLHRASQQRGSKLARAKI